ncbi:hypothetical protein S40293_10207 [Stachybotrys chartarum IBT 40293]|nr:hypothetical protein S40293_10207 [Stachybotrys chartarum IBT 40293]
MDTDIINPEHKPMPVNGPIVASQVIIFILATLSMILRMVAHYITGVKLWWDDYLIMCAYVRAITGGLSQRTEDLPIPAEDANEEARFSLFFIELAYAFSLYFSKASILSFYWRLFSKSNIRLPIQILQGCAFIWWMIRLWMGVFHCTPVQAFWDLTIEGGVCHINTAKFMFATTLVHLIMDCVILALPGLQVKNLQLRLGQKLAVVASIVVLITAFRLDPHTTELPHDITPVIIWAGVETVDNSSQQQFAELEDGSSGDIEFDHQFTNNIHPKSKVTITGGGGRSREHNGEESDSGNLYVTSEITVQYEKAKGGI